jgi:hypothetical protein
MRYEDELLAEIIRLRMDNKDLLKEVQKAREASQRSTLRIILRMCGTGDYVTA